MVYLFSIAYLKHRKDLFYLNILKVGEKLLPGPGLELWIFCFPYRYSIDLTKCSVNPQKNLLLVLWLFSEFFHG